jgi:hypothetical protein
MRRLEQCLVASLAVALLVVAVAEWNRRDRVQRPDTWTKAADLLKTFSLPGDTILLNNAGSTQGLHELQLAGLKVRLALPEPRGRIRRLWVIGTHRFSPKALGDLVPEALPKGDPPQGLYFAFYVRPAGSTLWRAEHELATAKINAAKRPCSQPKDGGWRCAHLADWMYVATTDLQRDGKGRNCLWAHPPSGGRPLIIRFDSVPSGELVFGHGMSEKASHSNNKEPVKVRLKWRGGAAESQIGNQPAWRTSKHRVEGFLELEISAKQDGQRHHCFTAAIR